MFLGATLALAGNASATSILYYVDHAVGTDHMGSALAALPGSFSVTTATSGGDFSTQLGTGTFDVAILAIQNSGSSAFGALDSFVSGGGAAILQTWLTATDLSAFDASFTGSANQNQVTVSDPALAAGLTSNPFSLTNPGWGIYSTDLGTAGGGSSAAVFEGGESAIVVGNGGRTIVNGFLTDTITDAAVAEKLYTNQIYHVSGGTTSVPDGGATFALLGIALGGLSLARRMAA